MKTITFLKVKKTLRMLAASIVLTVFSMTSFAQNAVVSTGVLGTGGGSGGIGSMSFAVINTNNYPMVIDSVGYVMRTTNNGDIFNLYYSETRLGGALTNFPNAPDWNLAGSYVCNVTGTVLEPNFKNLNLVIPANTAYRFVVQNTSNASIIIGTTTGTPNSYTNNGLTLAIGDYQLGGGNVGMWNTTTSARFGSAMVYASTQGMNDAMVMAIDSPTVFCAGTKNIYATIGNIGSNQIDSVEVHWELNGVAQTMIKYITVLDTIGGSLATNTTILLGSHNFQGPTDIKVWTAMPNGVVDTKNGNDTIYKTVGPAVPGGTYTVDATQTPSGNTYASIAVLVDEMSQFGICGPITINVAPNSGPYNEFLNFDNIAGTSATNYIRLNGAGNTVQYNNNATDRQLLILNGVSHVRIDSLNFKTLNATYGWAAVLTGGSEYDSITNCHFDLTSVSGSSSTNTNGITITGSTSSPTTAGDNASFCYIVNNHIEARALTGGPYYGITVYGTSTTVPTSEGNIIENNIIENFHYYGIRLYYALNNQVIGNEVHRANKTVSSGIVYGMQVGYSPGARILNNKIHSPGGVTGTSSSTLYGLYVISSALAAQHDSVLIANNAIYNINQGGIVYGIYMNAAQHVKVYNNTVELSLAKAKTQADYGIYSTGTATGSSIKNNIVSLTGGGTGDKYGFYYNTAASVGEAQMNNVYVNSTQAGNQYYGYYTTAYATQANFHSAYPTLEVNSPAVDPQFVNAASGDLTPQNSAVIEVGEDLSHFVITDINGRVRPTLPTLPTLGAFEKAPVSDDASVFVVDSPAGFCGGVQDIVVTIANAGSNQIDSVEVHWEINGTAQTSVHYKQLLDTLDGTGPMTAQVNLGSYNFTAPINLKVWTSMPNGVADANNANDTLETVIGPMLSGVVTINSASPTSGTNFESFADFIAYLNEFGVCGPVEANVVPNSGPYNEILEFGEIDGASAINHIRINGAGNTVEYTNDIDNRQLLILEGTKYLRIDSLNFKTLDATYGWAALITGGAAYDSITNCHFDLTSITGTSAANSNGIVFSGSRTGAITAGDNGEYCYIANNHIEGNTATGGPYYAIAVTGTSTSVPSSRGNIIINNEIENYHYYAIRIYSALDNQVIGNEVHRSNKTITTGIIYGLYVGYSSNIQVIENRLHSPQSSTSTSTSSAYGLHFLQSDSLFIANNAVYNWNQGGTMRGMYFSAVTNSKVYSNTVDFSADGNSASTMYGIYATGTNTGLDIKNNNVSITRGTTGIKYGFYYITVSSVDDAQQNNIYVNSTQSGTQYYGHLGVNFATQAAFQAAHPTLEVNSPAVDPQFRSASTGDFYPENRVLWEAGEDLLADVPFDIEGRDRSIEPTIGAYETPASLDLTVVSVDSPAVDFCEGDVQDVVVSVANLGFEQIDSVEVHWEANGVAQTPVHYKQLIDTIGGNNPDTVQILLGNYNFPEATELKIYVSNPNGGVDKVNGNDTLTILITPNPATVDSITAQICEGDQYILGSLTLDASGVYTDTLTSINGCDSIVTVTLDVLPVSTFDFAETICEGDTFVFGALNLADAGVYVDTLVAANGCDSIVTLTLEVGIDNGITLDNDTLWSAQEELAGVTYQWFECDTTDGSYSILSGETNRYFVSTTPDDENYYSVEVTLNNSCSDTSECMSFSTVGLAKNAASAVELSFSPNPTNGNFTIVSTGLESDNAVITIRDVSGRVILEESINNSSKSFKKDYNLSEQAKGIYFISIIDGNNRITKKLILK